MYSALLSALIASACIFAPVAAHPASPLAVHVVQEQYKNAKIVPDILPTFDPKGLLQVNYIILPKRIANGDVVAKVNTTTAPIVSIRTTVVSGASGGAFNVTDRKYTVLMIDGDYVGSSSPNGYNLHWLVNGYTYKELDDNQVFLNDPTDASDVVIPYAAPAPPSGSGPHRYIFILYEQPTNFTKPATPALNSGVARFNLATYTAAANLGSPLLSIYMTVEEGTATVTVAPTTAVNSLTLPEYTPTATGSGTAAPTKTGAALRTGAGVGYSLLAALAMIAGAVMA